MNYNARAQKIVAAVLRDFTETAGIGARWPRMTRAQRKDWLSRHPGSKYAKKLGDPVVGKGGKEPTKEKAPTKSKAPAKSTSKKAKAPSIHTGTSATKMSNDIMKHFKAKRLPNWSGSNKYDDRQHMNHSISAPNAVKLEEHLKASGWELDPESRKRWHKDKPPTEVKAGGRYKHPDGGVITVNHPERDYPHASVSVMGKKKSKSFDMPLYD